MVILLRRQFMNVRLIFLRSEFMRVQVFLRLGIRSVEFAFAKKIGWREFLNSMVFGLFSVS